MSDLVGTKGGAGVWQRIISEMPQHRVYIEPFWGRGTVARRKAPAGVTIGIDRDLAAVKDGAAAALMFQGCGLRWVRDYFRLDCAPAQPGADATFGGAPWADHFVYFDPPYLCASGRGYYRFELSEAEHRQLCRTLLELPCSAALSGYWSELYEQELGSARSIQIPTVNRAGHRVEEWLWMNYKPPQRYHDARFVGNGRRERERIRRRIRNWSQGFARMTPAERQAVWEVLDSVYRDAAGGVAGSGAG